ncbi:MULTISPECIES: Hsp70 family protein [unclassified Mesorhizobium]|uniref:Hsp70 family protein n=1 Tax=unclassified Mesorhizobium TaxID=325217 RepID=UPI000F75CCF5|nr:MULTISPECIES: Hsp70 family protein [unclassified Mesorhizobium]AZO05332.1 Hsp70 family protein [Mesorhizobium sp. M2A.F.Ca.ET.043.02.1.1]RUW40972.1 Hsp70 family protein [Mesorhizobium sp. M2A.F.Ca.ET.015.02.1.1]RUW65922.1 Hsp70 family protein [Mesorhizobium sp. M2A.F.Ca.ET.067.02.1.1]RVC96877.1 Hsp70 family protein [Mesorhizobium sp. M2A.F.Ca.ET.017.03.2.1]RVD01465.1 Hsp70 family protein [Mesorhizobium sp. M2A.F.Ca.ET.029.05.1.1]
MQSAFGGIDFGTSNSTVGVIRDGRARLVALEGEQPTLPSAVFFNFEDGYTYFGRRAISDYTDSIEGRLMRSLKSVLGSSLANEKTRIKARQIGFIDIIGMFVGHLKKRLEEDAGGPVENVVLGRPVQFVDEDTAADAKAQGELEKAARAQGFKYIAFQFEPIAAALDYEQKVTREELALIVDMGGGTSDFSIVRVSPERARSTDRKADILANRGIHIGGTDFDRLLSIAHVMPELGYLTRTKDHKRNLPAAYFIDLATWQRINLVYTAKAMSDLRQIRYEAEGADLVDRFIHVVEHRYGHAMAGLVERAKIALTDQPSAEVKVSLPGARFAAEITRAGLEETIANDIERVSATVKQTIADAGVDASAITAVFLTGGSTAIPLAKRAILSLVPQASVIEGDMFGSVGLGLALDAQRKYA